MSNQNRRQLVCERLEIYLVHLPLAYRRLIFALRKWRFAICHPLWTGPNLYALNVPAIAISIILLGGRTLWLGGLWIFD